MARLLHNCGPRLHLPGGGSVRFQEGVVQNRPHPNLSLQKDDRLKEDAPNSRPSLQFTRSPQPRGPVIRKYSDHAPTEKIIERRKLAPNRKISDRRWRLARTGADDFFGWKILRPPQNRPRPCIRAVPLRVRWASLPGRASVEPQRLPPLFSPSPLTQEQRGCLSSIAALGEEEGGE